MSIRRRNERIRASMLAGSVICAVGFGVPEDAAAEPAEGQQEPKTDSQDIQEIVVTAARHESRILDIPYNISAVTGDNLAQRGITDLTNLGQIMPGLDYPNQGAGRDAFSTPVIRGLNLTSSNRNFYPLGGESPVSTYIGDTPVSGRFPLNDLARVEVLRGPQGTLYGAGAIGGTIRLIPNDPETGAYEGHIEASLSTLDHSEQPSYGLDGVINVPINDRMAFRLSTQYQAEAGFIDAINLVKRTSGSAIAPAVLANQNDVAGSASIRYTGKDVNWSETYGGRAALLVQATDTLRFNFSFNYSHVAGGDNPAINTSFRGGPDVVDPRILVPTPGRYDQLNYVLQPYNRDSLLPAVDVSWDLGFATLASNTGYFDSHGVSVEDTTYVPTGYPAGFAQYYTGNPTFPRYINPVILSTGEKDVTEEIRLVSTTKGSFDYVAGAFYSHAQNTWTTNLYAPGAGAWDAATPSPILPIVVYPNSGDLYFSQFNEQSSIDRAIYGELTYHLSPTVQVTGGGRYYWHKNSSSNSIADSVFGFTSASLNDFSNHGALGKLNASWNYVNDHKLYATFSQGFRPGGANGIPLMGAVAESPSLLTYKPDRATNYEVGGKGTFGPALAYSLDVYYIDLKDAQLSEITPVGWPVVLNTNGATTKGVEVEVNGRVIDHLTYNAGYSHTIAVVSRNFDILTHFGAIGGSEGQQLPGSPRDSASVSLTYDFPLGAYDLQSTAGASYKGPMQTSLQPTSNVFLPGYTLTNLNVTLKHQKWHVTAFVNNLTNARAITSATSPSFTTGSQGQLSYIEPPRELGMRLGYSF